MKYDPEAHGAACSRCPLSQNDTMVPPDGDPRTAELVFVGDSPGPQDVNRRVAFVKAGQSGLVLDELLEKANLPRSRVHLTYAVLCRIQTPGIDGMRKFDSKTYFAWLRKENGTRKKAGLPLIESPVDCCRPRLMRELRLAEEAAKSRGAPGGAVAIPAGNIALSSIAGKSGVTKLRGSQIAVTLDEEEK